MTVAHVFTGQGFNPAQVVDHSKTPAYPMVADAFARTFGHALPPLHDVSEETLRRNEVSAAVLLLSAFENMRIARDRLPRPDVVAGYSVGQYLALCHAGAIGESDTTSLVFDRCRVMNDATQIRSATLVAAVGAPLEKLQTAIAASTLQDKAVLANDNAVGNYTFAVPVKDAEEFLRLCTDAGAFRTVNLNTDGGWHSRYLDAARAPFRAALERYTLADPAVPVIDNTYVSESRLRAETAVDTLTEHLVSPVRWRETVKHFKEAGVTEAVEVTEFDLLKRMSVFTAPTIKFATMASACAA